MSQFSAFIVKWNEKSLDGNETPRRQKVPICRGKGRDERPMFSIGKKNTHTLKIKNMRDCHLTVIRLDR